MGIRFADARKWDIPLAYDDVHFTKQSHKVYPTGLLPLGHRALAIPCADLSSLAELSTAVLTVPHHNLSLHMCREYG